MKITVFYATYSSGTQDASVYLVNHLAVMGHEAQLADVRDFEPANYKGQDILVFATPSWERESYKYNGQPHAFYFAIFNKYGYLVDLPEKNRTSKLKLHGQRVGIFGLGDSTYAVFCGGVDYLQDFFAKSGATVVCEPIRLDGYLFNTATCNKQLEDFAETIAGNL